MTIRNRALTATFIFFALPLVAAACEPVVQLMILYSGTTWSAMGVTGKTLGPIVLLVVVIIKALSFAVFERRFPWWQSSGYMFLGNIVSTGAGMLAALMYSSGILFLIFMPMFLGAAAPTLRRLKERSPHPLITKVSLRTMMFSILGLAILSNFLFVIGIEVLDAHNYKTYWLVKYGYVVVGLGIGIVLTSLWEEWAIAAAAQGKLPERSFYTSVLRANSLTLGIIFLAGAIIKLPQRLNHPGFIAWLRDLAGLT